MKNSADSINTAVGKLHHRFDLPSHTSAYERENSDDIIRLTIYNIDPYGKISSNFMRNHMFSHIDDFFIIFNRVFNDTNFVS